MAQFHLPWRGAAWVIVAICALAGCTESKPPDRLVMGQAFPGLSLQGLDGKQVPLTAFRGKLVVLNVWATWCPPCRKELPSLQRLSRRLDKGRFVIVGLSLDQDNVAVREYLHDRGVTYVNFLDRNLDIAKNVLGMKAYPDTFFIAPDGTLLGRVVGAIDWDNSRMMQALEAAYRGDGDSLRDLPRGVYGSS
jgi:thiol-disulfide isomerase/thioredoxin